MPLNDNLVLHACGFMGLRHSEMTGQGLYEGQTLGPEFEYKV